MANNESLSGLKVLMLLDNAFASDARVEKEARTLVEEGVELTVLCTQDDTLKAKESRNGYSIRRSIPEGYNAPLRSSYKTFIQSLVEKILTLDFHVLHCHDFYMLSIGAEIKKQLPEIKLIYDAHEYLKGWPFYKTSDGLNKFKGKLVWQKLVRKEKQEIQLADAVCTITSGIAQRLMRNNDLETLPIVIGNYPIKFEPDIQEGYFHSKYNLPSEMKVLVHAGTIYHSDDQLQALFNIIEQNPDVVLVFLGNRPRFYDIEASVKTKEALKNTVFFHPYPDTQEEVIDLLGSADFGLLHIIDQWEAHKIGFSNRFVEYIMAGIPVVASPQEFTEEFNSHYPCAVFYQTDQQDELAGAIETIVSNYDVYRVAANEARNALDWELESEKLINLYQVLLK